MNFEAALVAFIKTYLEMSLNVPPANAPRGQTTSAPPVVETAARSAMHSALQQGAVTSPRQSPRRVVSGSPAGSIHNRPSPVIVLAPRNFIAINFRLARQPAHAAVAQPAIPTAASAHGVSASIDALGGLRTYHENRGKLSNEEELLRQAEKALQDQREKVAGLAVQLNIQGR